MRTRSQVKSSDPIDWAVNGSTRSNDCTGSLPMTEWPAFGSPGTHVEYSESMTMQDEVTPNWSRRRNQGHIIQNPMNKVTVVEHNPLVDFEVWYAYAYWDCDPRRWITAADTQYGGNIQSLHWLVPYGADLVMDDALPAKPVFETQSYEDLAVNRAWSNVSLNEADMLVTIAEGQKSIYSLVAIFTRFVKILRNLKRLQGKKLLLELSGKELADRYMELRYALRPLVYDYNNIVKALSKQVQDVNSRLTFRGFEDDIIESTEATDPLYTWQDTTDTNGRWVKGGTKSTLSSASIDVRAGVLAELETVSRLPVWGLTMPVEAALELLPFSFIVGWFFNTAETIAAWTPNFGLKALSSWSVCTTTVVQTAELTDSWAFVEPPASTVRKPLGHAFGLEDGCRISRTTVTKTRVPNPQRATMPIANLRMDVLKLADLLIIAKKILSKR